MIWWMYLPAVAWVLFVAAGGLAVGSFLNVVVARLPVGKTPVWPTDSYCFACRRPLGLWDNLPVVGYLRAGGRCRQCGARFSARYLWVEVGTAAAFVALFVVEVLLQSTNGPGWLRPWHHAPGLRFPAFGPSPLPPAVNLVFFAYHAVLLALLIACAAVDAEHRVIPHELTYLGVLIGLVGSALLPWPWPSLDPATLGRLPDADAWPLPESLALVPTGATLWPAWVPADSFAPGTWQLGLLNGLVGAAVGTFLVRGLKWVVEYGLGQEAMGLGDADLMMMVGAFLGWPVVVLGFFAGAVAALLMQVPVLLADALGGRQADRHMPFGPGLAVGSVLVWWGWPLATPVAQKLYSGPLLVLGVLVFGGGMLLYGLARGRPAGTGEGGA